LKKKTIMTFYYKHGGIFDQINGPPIATIYFKTKWSQIQY